MHKVPPLLLYTLRSSKNTSFVVVSLEVSPKHLRQESAPREEELPRKNTLSQPQAS